MRLPCTAIAGLSPGQDASISLTDLAKKLGDDSPIYNWMRWMRNRDAVEFLGIWEQIHNPEF